MNCGGYKSGYTDDDGDLRTAGGGGEKRERGREKMRGG